ncbi:MAG: nucleotidyltransferase family protein [Oscillospiraceae bacterium]|nr:nucleotidyltransferase family protein [Oscillospiraceae bacterium]
MNATQRGIVTLLKSSVTGESLALPEGFDLEEAYPMIRRHHMATMAYEGARNCGISTGHPVMQKLFQSYCKAYLVSEGQMEAFGRICAAFDANGIDYMPLKGCRMKLRYPKPELRMMGDADILIRLEQYDRIIPIMEGLGFQAKSESDHELVWTSDKLYVELHKRLIPSYNKNFHGYFGDGWQLAKEKEGTRYSMTAEDEWIYLFTHFAKHYRDGGIGCRHVVDLWVYLRTNPGLDETFVRAELKKLQLLEFYQNIRQLLEVWFADAPADEKMEIMTNFVFDSGSWGVAESRAVAQAVRGTKLSSVRISGKMAFLLQNMFPSVETLRGKYRVLKKAPWLLPVVWLVRPFYKLLFERKSLLDKKKSLDKIDQKEVDARQQMLNYVGLDCNF